MCNVQFENKEKLESHMIKEKHYDVPSPNQTSPKLNGLGYEATGNIFEEKIDFYNNVLFLFPIIDFDPLLTLNLSQEQEEEKK